MDGRKRMVLTQRDARQHEPGADSQPTDIRARQLHADASVLGTDVRRLTAPACLESLMLRQAQQNGKFYNKLNRSSSRPSHQLRAGSERCPRMNRNFSAI